MFTQLCYEHMEFLWQHIYYAWAQWKPCCANANITSTMVAIMYTSTSFGGRNGVKYTDASTTASPILIILNF